MTTINCKFLDAIRKDFDSLWHCKVRGNTIEVSTPYLLPDSTLFSVFITHRNGKFIVHDGGSVSGIVASLSPFPKDEIDASLDGFSTKYEIKHTKDAQKKAVFYKDCEKKSSIGSAIFDLANFALNSSQVLISTSYDEPDIEPDKRFERTADAFVKNVLPNGLNFKPKQSIPQVPGVTFSGIIHKASRMWIIAYVTGSNPSYFLRSIAMANMSFEHVWQMQSSLKDHIGKTIPLINTDANGYQPNKQKWQLEMLNKSSKNELLNWQNRDSLVAMLN